MNTLITKSAEQRAKELLLHALNNIDLCLTNKSTVEKLDKDICLTAIIAERDSWKEKFTTLNKELMCELRDPNGTICDVAKDLQKENEEMQAVNKTLHDLMKTAENRGVGKATIELGEKINKLQAELKDAVNNYQQQYMTTLDIRRNCDQVVDKLQSQLACLKSVAGDLAKQLEPFSYGEIDNTGSAIIKSLTAYNQWRKENE